MPSFFHICIKMTFTAIILVLTSVVMHASWNFLSKKTLPCAAFFFVSSSGAALAWIWSFAYCGIPEGLFSTDTILLLVLSLTAESAYLFGLFKAYEKTNISLAYPMIRVLAVLLLFLVAVFSGNSPSITATIALVIVFCGCLLMPLERFSDFTWRNYANRSMFFILLSALGTTGYTLTDSFLIRNLTEAYSGIEMYASWIFTFLINGFLAVIFGIYSMLNKKERMNLKKMFSSGKMLGMAVSAGVLSAVAYLLILLAMTQTTQLSYLQAFRQAGLPFGMFLGWFFLHEKIHLPKRCGILLLLIGLVLIALWGK